MTSLNCEIWYLQTTKCDISKLWNVISLSCEMWYFQAVKRDILHCDDTSNPLNVLFISRDMWCLKAVKWDCFKPWNEISLRRKMIFLFMKFSGRASSIIESCATLFRQSDYVHIKINAVNFDKAISCCRSWDFIHVVLTYTNV